MLQELDSLKKEIEKTLQSEGFVVYHGLPRRDEPLPTLDWDVDSYPDPAMFLAAAKKLEVRLILFHHRFFTGQMIEQARHHLEAVDMPREEAKEYGRTLKRLGAYEGFTCSLELSFDFDNNTYLFEAMTPWYREFLAMLDELESIDNLDAGEEDDEDSPLGGYYSQN